MNLLTIFIDLVGGPAILAGLAAVLFIVEAILSSETARTAINRPDSRKEAAPSGQGARLHNCAVILKVCGIACAAFAALWSAYSQKQLNEKNDETARTLTGGDSFPFVEVSQDGDRVVFFITNQGKYPVYDLTARVLDLDNPEETRKGPALLPGHRIGTLPPNDVPQVFEPLPSFSGDYLRLHIIFNGPYCNVLEEVRIRRMNGKYRLAMRVRRILADGSGKVIYQSSNSGPFDEAGPPRPQKKDAGS